MAGTQAPKSRTRSGASGGDRPSEPCLLAIKSFGGNPGVVGMWEDLADVASAVPESHRKIFMLTNHERLRWAGKDPTLAKENLESYPAALVFSSTHLLTPPKKGSPSALQSPTGPVLAHSQAAGPGIHKATYAPGYALSEGESKKKGKNTAQLCRNGKKCYAVSFFGKGKLPDGTERSTLEARIFNNYSPAQALFEGGSGARHRSFTSTPATSCYTQAAQWLVQEGKWTTAQADQYLQNKLPKGGKVTEASTPTISDTPQPSTPSAYSSEQESEDIESDYSHESDSLSADDMSDEMGYDNDTSLAAMEACLASVTDPATGGEASHTAGTQEYAPPPEPPASEIIKNADMACFAGNGCFELHSKIPAGSIAVFCSNDQHVLHPACAETLLKGKPQIECTGCNDGSSIFTLASVMKVQNETQSARTSKLEDMMLKLGQSVGQVQNMQADMQQGMKDLTMALKNSTAPPASAPPALAKGLVLMVTGLTPDLHNPKASNERAWACLEKACEPNSVTAAGFGAKAGPLYPYYVIFNAEAMGSATMFLAAFTQTAIKGRILLRYEPKTPRHDGGQSLVYVTAKILDRIDEHKPGGLKIEPNHEWLVFDTDLKLPCVIQPAESTPAVLTRLKGLRFPTYTEEIADPTFKPKDQPLNTPPTARKRGGVEGKGEAGAAGKKFRSDDKGKGSQSVHLHPFPCQWRSLAETLCTIFAFIHVTLIHYSSGILSYPPTQVMDKNPHAPCHSERVTGNGSRCDQVAITGGPDVSSTSPPIAPPSIFGTPSGGEHESGPAIPAAQYQLPDLAQLHFFRTQSNGPNKSKITDISKRARGPARFGRHIALFVLLWVLTLSSFSSFVEAGKAAALQPRSMLPLGSSLRKRARPAGQPEINLNPKSKPYNFRKKRKTLKMKSPQIPLLNILTWNVNGILDEDKTYLLLDAISSQWPDIQVVLLTETHLRESSCNSTLHSHPKWEVHRVDHYDPSGKTKQGGLVLLTARGQFAVSLLDSYPQQHLSAGTWRLLHASWVDPIEISGMYRPWPHGPASTSVEDKQLEGFTMLAEHIQQSRYAGLLLGDLNLHFGTAQERLTHTVMQDAQPRVSAHDPQAPLTSLAAQALNIVSDHELFILNGRFGDASARHTFAPLRKTKDGADVRSTVDYGLAHQSIFPRIVNMRVDLNFSGPYDHRPVITTLKCPVLPKAVSPADRTEWLPAVDRGLLNVAPMMLPAWEEEGVKQRYLDLLAEKLTPCIQRMQSVSSQLARCPQTSNTLTKQGLCSRTCPCQTLGEEIHNNYDTLTTGILESAAACLPHKSSPAARARSASLPSFWKPDNEWYKLKKVVETTREKEAHLAHGSPAEQEAARGAHRAAYHALRLYTTESRARWTNKRLSTISLLAPAHTVKATWQVLKRQLGSEAQSGLPAVVKTAQGDILKGQAATNHWHTARVSIGKFDATAPFDTQAHKARTLHLKKIREGTHAAPSPPQVGSEGDRLNDGITKAEIERALSKIKNGKAPGVDEIYNDFLTQGGDTIVEALRLLYNLVWVHKQGPEAWNKALIRPLYKVASKDPLLTENYRAITLISTICKVYEAILCERVVAHLESTKRLSPSQGSRRFMGCEDLVYTVITTARDRYTHNSAGTYACFIDFKLAYPSTDHSVILTKLHAKGICGRLWHNIDGLYKHMQSHVLHPHIPDDDYFDIEVGVREGSVLSPILFLVAVDDMCEYLMKHPFYPPRDKRNTGGSNAKGRAPGVWIGHTYLGLLQYVDDAVLLANSPQELQHMIKVIAQYCFENRLTLNPKAGKTEIVEFLCPPSGTSYSVPLPTRENPASTTDIGVVQGYPYLGWWLDKDLTLDQHTTNICRKVSSATARVTRMGGRPGGLPVRTTFQLWSALALPYVYGSAALLSNAQIERIQHRLLEAVKQMAGHRVAPQAVLADLGLPDAHLIRDLRVSSLFARLRTLPTILAPACLHTFLCQKLAARTTGFEGAMYSLLLKLGVTNLWDDIGPPVQTLHSGLAPAPKGEVQHNPILHARRQCERQLYRSAWALRGKALRTGTAPFDDDKTRAYAVSVHNDLCRKDIQSCAPYLKLDLSPQQEACMMLFRTQGSLLASHAKDAQAYNLCHACEFLPHANQDMVEDAEHVLLHCCRKPFAGERAQFNEDMAEQFDEFNVLLPGRSPTTWKSLDGETQARLALGDAIPTDWLFQGMSKRKAPAARRELQTALIAAAAPHLQTIATGLRAYKKAVAADLQSGNATQWANALDCIDQLGPVLDDASDSDDE